MVCDCPPGWSGHKCENSNSSIKHQLTYQQQHYLNLQQQQQQQGKDKQTLLGNDRKVKQFRSVVFHTVGIQIPDIRLTEL